MRNSEFSSFSESLRNDTSVCGGQVLQDTSKTIDANTSITLIHRLKYSQSINYNTRA